MTVYDVTKPQPCSVNYNGNNKKIEEYRKGYGLTERDSVSFFIVPKGMAGKREGSFITKQLTLKSQQLQQKLYDINGQIRTLQGKNMPAKDKQKAIDRLKAQKHYVSMQLNAEKSSSPYTGFVVIEEDINEDAGVEE